MYMLGLTTMKMDNERYLDVSAEFLPLHNPANRKIRLIFG